MAIVHRVTIGGVTDTTLGIQLLAGYDDPVAPQTRDRLVVVPGRAGVYDFGADLDKRDFNLRFAFVETTTQAALKTAIRTLNETLFDDDGKPEDVSLVFTKEPAKTYTVRYLGSMPLSTEVGGTLGYFDLPLIAADPYAYGDEDTDTASITAAYQEVEVVNAGGVKTPTEITVTNNGLTDVTGFTLICRQIK